MTDAVTQNPSGTGIPARSSSRITELRADMKHFSCSLLTEGLIFTVLAERAPLQFLPNYEENADLTF